MQSNQLQKAINLAKKTGDRLIVFDAASSQEPFVVMGLAEYEKLVIGHNEVRGLTENELLDKINRDVAIWKSNTEFDNLPNYSNEDNNEDLNHLNDFSDDFEKKRSDSPIEGMYKNDFSSPGLKEMKESLFKKRKGAGNGWSIPRDRKQAAEEVVDEDEDRQYLEELPF